MRARIDGETVSLTDGIPKLEKNKRHNIELVADRLTATNGIGKNASRTRVVDSVETTLAAGEGVLIVGLRDEDIILTEDNACPECALSFPKLEPNLFSFNSPIGMCETCTGMGVKLQLDTDLIVGKPDVSLLDGASAWFGNIRKKGVRWTARSLVRVAEACEVDLELPWKELPETFREVILYGSGDRKFYFSYEAADGSWRGESHRPYRGIVHEINRLYRQTKSQERRRFFTQFMSKRPCPSCQGERLCAEARFVAIDGKRLPELTSWSIQSLHEWIGELPLKVSEEQLAIGGELLTEIHQRLDFIRNVGLHYLTLDRPAPTLSGGEGQRIRLASQIGSGLVGVLYILDEPSIGLHARDQRALLDTLIHLRDIGNTVLVVEHDADTMRFADWIIDLGPEGGEEGGWIVAEGTPEAVAAVEGSHTGRVLREAGI